MDFPYSFDPTAYYNHTAKPLGAFYESVNERTYKAKGNYNSEENSHAWARYNQTDEFIEVLLSEGWTIASQSKKKIRFTRPGKAAGISAEYDSDKNVFFVWTSNGEPFEANKGYSPFAVYSILMHDGDYKEAAKKLQIESDFKTLNL